MRCAACAHGGSCQTLREPLADAQSLDAVRWSALAYTDLGQNAVRKDWDAEKLQPNTPSAEPGLLELRPHLSSIGRRTLM